ncbi:unnamed protein product [Closterium sp. Naga37s-1]|nr:unnamed protein product [Closterium sp. Naga37s-1]
MRSDIFLAITENSIPVAIPLTPLIAHYAILEFAKSPSRLPFRRASRRHLAARPVALFVALSPLLSSRRPLSRPSLLIALPSLSAPFPSPSLSPLPSRRVLSLCSLPVALSVAPPFPLRSLSLLPSRRPLSRPSLPVALSLSAPFPSPSLSPLPYRRALSLCTLPVALSLAPPFPSRSLSPLRPLSRSSLRIALSLRSLPVALSLSAPFPLPSLFLLPSRPPFSLASNSPPGNLRLSHHVCPPFSDASLVLPLLSRFKSKAAH